MSFKEGGRSLRSNSLPPRKDITVAQSKTPSREASSSNSTTTTTVSHTESPKPNTSLKCQLGKLKMELRAESLGVQKSSTKLLYISPNGRGFVISHPNQAILRQSLNTATGLDEGPLPLGDDNPTGPKSSTNAVFYHYDVQSTHFTIENLFERLQQISLSEQMTSGASLTTSDQADPAFDVSQSNNILASCAHFRNEIDVEPFREVFISRSSVSKSLKHLLKKQPELLRSHPICNAISRLSNDDLINIGGFVIEYIDSGCTYYREYFMGCEHQNFFASHEEYGPIAISLKREKLEKGRYIQRIIMRTSHLPTLRGFVLEDQLTGFKNGSKGMTPRAVIENVLPNLNLQPFKLAQADTEERLLQLDEQSMRCNYKFGVLFCRPGQTSEEEFYANEMGSTFFHDFLSVLGDFISLKDFRSYKGGLDVKQDTTGLNSVYTRVGPYQIMYHVSTLLPFTPNDKQQLARKKHIGNDFVTLVFQEPGSAPFTPKYIKSNFQHVFIVVRPKIANATVIGYKIAVARSKYVPPFGPLLPPGGFFDRSNSDFRNFLLVKCLNAENAVHRSNKLIAMAVRTRREYLRDLTENYVTQQLLDNPNKFGRLSFKGGRLFRGNDKNKQAPAVDVLSLNGGIVWRCYLEDCSENGDHIMSKLIVSNQHLLLMIDESVVFTIPLTTIIGYRKVEKKLKIYFNRGENISMYFTSLEMLNDVIAKLLVSCDAREASAIIITCNSPGNFGITLDQDCIVCRIPTEHSRTSLPIGSRIVEISQMNAIALTHKQRLDMLSSSCRVPLVFLHPNQIKHIDRYDSNKVIFRTPSYMKVRNDLKPPQSSQASQQHHFLTPSTASSNSSINNAIKGQLLPITPDSSADRSKRLTERTHSDETLFSIIPPKSGGLQPTPPASTLQRHNTTSLPYSSNHYKLSRSPEVYANGSDFQTPPSNTTTASPSSVTVLAAGVASANMPHDQILRQLEEEKYRRAKAEEEVKTLKAELDKQTAINDHFKQQQEKVEQKMRKFSQWFFNTLEDDSIAEMLGK